MLHAGKGRSAFHRNRKPQGTGTPTPTPSVGNLILASNWADFLTKEAAMVSGDVVSINHAGYTPTLPGVVYTPTHAVSGLGGTVIGASNQPVILKIANQANLQMEFVNWYGDADTVNGNETQQVAAFGSSCYATGSSGFAIRGCVFTRGMWNIYNLNNSNFVEENNVCQYTRADFMRLDGSPAQFQIKGNYFGDVATNNIMWWYPNGTTPVFGGLTNPGGATFYDKEHNDGIQAYLGAMVDAEISGNSIFDYGQGAFITTTTGTPQTRVKFSGNTVRAADPYQLIFDDGLNIEVSGNAFSSMSPMNPDSTDAKITITATNIKIGQNTVNYGALPVTYVGVTQAAFTAGSITGTATAPTAPTWTGTTSNVGNLNTLRQRKTPATPPSPPKPASLPIILPSGGVTTGTPCTARPPLWNPFTPGMEDNLYTRWSLDGAIVRASTQGRAAFVYTPVAAGALTVEFSSNNSVWSTPSDPTTVTSSTNTFLTGVTNVTYANGNQTVTKSTANAATMVRALNGRSATTNVQAGWTYNPNQITGGDIYLGLCDGTTTGVSHRILMNGANIYGGVIGSESFIANMLPGALKDGTDTWKIYYTITGGGTLKIWINSSTNGWLNGGDPNSGGTGIDVTIAGLTGTIYPYVNITNIGDSVAANYALPSGLPVGTVAV